jgi:hypothetical protein
MFISKNEQQITLHCTEMSHKMSKLIVQCKIVHMNQYWIYSVTIHISLTHLRRKWTFREVHIRLQHDNDFLLAAQKFLTFWNTFSSSSYFSQKTDKWSGHTWFYRTFYITLWLLQSKNNHIFLAEKLRDTNNFFFTYNSYTLLCDRNYVHSLQSSHVPNFRSTAFFGYKLEYWLSVFLVFRHIW